MSLRDYIAVLNRRKSLALMFLVLTPTIALFLELRKPDVFSASADALITNQNAAALLGLPTTGLAQQDAERFAQTQASIARAPELARQTLRAAGVKRETARSFLDRSGVNARPNEDLLEFVVEDERARRAVALATEYARQFPVYRRRLTEASLERTQAEIQQRLDQLEVENQRGSVLYRTLSRQRQQLSAIEALQTTSAQLVRPAEEAIQIAPRPVRAFVLGLILGLLVWVALAFAWDALDSRIRSPDEIVDALSLPLLARIPSPPKNLRQGGGLITLEDPTSVGAETFRMLRTNIEFVSLGVDAKTILVTSATAAEGKTTTCVNLGVALAQSGKRVVIVDCDLRRPAVAESLDLRHSAGLSDVALGRHDVDQVVQLVDVHGQRGGKRLRSLAGSASVDPGALAVLASGPLPPNPGEFVGTQAVADILASLRETYDVVLIDTPPILQVGDAMSLSRHVDAVLVVVRLTMATKHTVAETRRMLDASPALKLGLVITDAERELAAYAGYGSYVGPKTETREAGVA